MVYQASHKLPLEHNRLARNLNWFTYTLTPFPSRIQPFVKRYAHSPLTGQRRTAFGS
jgi:hypothetical protein